MQARRYLVSGQVQGVGFRFFTSKAGRDLHVVGWVRNLSDGRVEAYAVGPERQLEAFEARLRKGPPRADVRSVEVEEAVLDDRIGGFNIR